MVFGYNRGCTYWFQEGCWWILVEPGGGDVANKGYEGHIPKSAVGRYHQGSIHRLFGCRWHDFRERGWERQSGIHYWHAFSYWGRKCWVFMSPKRIKHLGFLGFGDTKSHLSGHFIEQILMVRTMSHIGHKHLSAAYCTWILRTDDTWYIMIHGSAHVSISHFGQGLARLPWC